MKTKVLIFCAAMSLMMVAAVNASEYQTALEKSADYLVSIQDGAGFWSKKPGGSWDADAENATGNAIAALLEAYNIVGKAAYKTAAIDAGDYLISEFIAGDGSFDLHQAEIIGGNAYMNHLSPFLTAWLMLYQETGQTKYLDAATAFGDYLLTDGARCTDAGDPLYGLFGYLIRPGSPGLPCFGSPASLYHGHYLNYGYEQIYGLAWLSQITANSDYLDAAELGAGHELSYQKVDGSFPDEMGGTGTLGIHYASVKALAYIKLYDLTNDSTYKDAVVEYLDWLLTQQNMDDSFGNPDYVRSTTWAAKALLGGYRLTGDGAYVTAAKEAIDWLLASGHGYDSSTGEVARYDASTDVYIAYSQTPFILTMAETEVWVDAATGDDSNPGTKAEPFATIQKGVAVVADGGIVNVAAGTYDEQVVIDKALTLQGAGDTTLIQPSSAAKLTTVNTTPWLSGGTKQMAAIVWADAAGSTVTVKNLKIDGSNLTSLPGGIGTGDWVAGLSYIETSGTVDDVTVVEMNMGDTPRTCGIWTSAVATTSSVEVKDCNVTNYNRAGVYGLGDHHTVNFHHNTIAGPGTVQTTQVPNSIFLLDGCTGSATYNDCSGNYYVQDEYRATGIGTYDAGTGITFAHNTVYDVQNAFALNGGSDVTIENNTIYDCHTGVRIEKGTDWNIIRSNSIKNNAYAIRCSDNLGDNNVAYYNKFVGNTGTDPNFLTYVGAVSHREGSTHTLDARYNWWGASDGPGPVGPGSGDTVSINVDYDPWFTAEPDLVVDPDGNGDYTTIQDAIDNANPGDTIIVVSGTYSGAIVDRDVTIIGSSNPSVITSGVPYKAGSSLTTAFRLEDTADGAEIKNFTIECDMSSSFYFAVFARSADDVTIDSLVVNESVQGITNYGGSNWEITNNIISNSLPASGGGISIWLGVTPPTYPVCSGNLIEGNRIITNYPGAVTFTCPAVGMGIDCRYGGYDKLTGSEEMANNQILNNIMKDEGHSNQVGVEIGVLGLEGDPVKIAAVIGLIHDNIVKENTIQNTDMGVYFYNISTLTIEDNTIRNCATDGVSIEGDQSGCVITNNSITGNVNYGVNNNAPTTINAENNWWGAADGPDDDAGLINGSGDAISLNVDADPWLGADPWINILKLEVQDDPVYLQPGEIVVIDMDALDLAQHVFGCQAVLNFDSTYFLAGVGEVDVQPGGGVWNELIWGQWTVTGDLDVAVGVDLSTVVGTRADGTVAKFTLTATTTDGTTNMIFRADGSEDIEQTYFADFLAQRVDPGSKINSQTIVIDGTNPDVTVDYPNGGENLKGGQTYDIQWTTIETNNDYVDLEYTSDDGANWSDIAAGETDDGSYTWTVPTDDTDLAKVRVTATDLAGNSGSDVSDATFIIDSTDPVVTDLTATEDSVDVLDCANTTIQGTVGITVDASDALAGLVGVPTITVIGPETLTAILVDGVGPVYGWTVDVTSATLNGTYTITITATDKAGNDDDITGTLCVNKNEIEGEVELESLVDTSRAVTFYASGGVSTKEWTPTLSFSGSKASYTLTEVPNNTTHLSAKANWNLRVKLATPLTDGQGTADFTDTNKLRGGDINGSNTTNILDFAVLKINWFTTNAVADINGDGKVNVPDFLLLKNNWFQKGDVE